MIHRKLTIVLIIAFSFLHAAADAENSQIKKEINFSVERFCIESLSSFASGGLLTLGYLSTGVTNKSWEAIGTGSVITYSLGNPIGGSVSSIILRKKFSIKPILCSSIGSAVGLGLGYMVSKADVKAGEYTILILVPILSGIGAEIAF